jgi:hypothetical protein
MIDRATEESVGPPGDSGDRLVVKFDPGGPVELTGLTESFAGLARMYERHYRSPEATDTVPKLYITRLESGSIIAEIAPYATMLGAIVTTMDSGMVISDFTRRLYSGIKAFSDPGASTPELSPTRDDATDLQAFVRPLAGKRGAQLSIKHAKYERRDSKSHTVVEYDFDETEINRATVNIDQALAGVPQSLLLEDHIEELEEAPSAGSILGEVMLFFEQASRRPGKVKGRTGDRGIVPDVSPKSLPVYFRKSIQDLKDLMVKGEINPLTNYAFVVDVHVQRVNGKPRAYIVTDVHRVIPVSGDR